VMALTVKSRAYMRSIPITWTIRDWLWSSSLIAISLAWWCDHSAMHKDSLHERFNHEALRWETWHSYNSRLSVLDPTEHDSFTQLASMGSPIVPMVMERWSGKSHPDLPGSGPPWWLLLEKLTGEQMISDEEKLAKLPAALRGSLDPRGVVDADLERRRWLEWWKNKGASTYR